MNEMVLTRERAKNTLVACALLLIDRVLQRLERVFQVLANRLAGDESVEGIPYPIGQHTLTLEGGGDAHLGLDAGDVVLAKVLLHLFHARDVVVRQVDLL